MSSPTATATSKKDDKMGDMEEYILNHIDPEGQHLRSLYRDTHLHLLRPRMASGHYQGRLLKMLVRMIQPRVIVEIGTYSGYSTLSMAEGLDDGAMIHTFEINDEQEDFTRPRIEATPWADKIQMHIGDVMEILPKMDITIDMSFIDGNKRDYIAYYELILQKTRPGGFILADNTLWSGLVVDSGRHDHQTEAIRQFNDYVADDKRVEKIILPVRDGLTIIHKL